MVVLERPDRLLLLHQLDPSGPAAGYNPVHVFSPTHLRTPSPVPPSPCADVLGVVVDVADVAAARMSGRSRRAPAGAPLMQSSVRASRHLTRFRPVPLPLRAGPPPRCPGCARARARGSASRISAPRAALADELSDPLPEPPDELRVLPRDQPLAAGVPESVRAVRADLHRGVGLR